MPCSNVNEFSQSSNSYTVGCPSVRGDNPRALASGSANVQVYKHGKAMNTTYIVVDLAHHEIVRAKVGKGGINVDISWYLVGFSQRFKLLHFNWVNTVY